MCGRSPKYMFLVDFCICPHLQTAKLEGYEKIPTANKNEFDIPNIFQVIRYGTLDMPVRLHLAGINKASTL